MLGCLSDGLDIIGKMLIFLDLLYSVILSLFPTYLHDGPKNKYSSFKHLKNNGETPMSARSIVRCQSFHNKTWQK